MDIQTKALIGVLLLALVAIVGAVFFKPESAFDRYARMVCAQSKQACDNFYATANRPDAN